MIINTDNAELKRALRVLDANGERVSNLLWFNTSSNVGSAVINGKEQRVEASSFCFVGDTDRLKKLLPSSLHHRIVSVS